MLIPHKKSQYALRAIYELAKRKGEGPTKISDIAIAQAIPRRFLEVILNQMKGSGIVASKRGFYGGYVLTKSPDQVTVGDVFRHLQKDQERSICIACMAQKACPFLERCVFSTLWHDVKAAAFQIYDKTTMQDLLDANEKAKAEAR
jgi:Rrf2 family protein